MSETNSALVPPQEVAAKIHTTVGTLAVWRCTQRYPLRYVKVGRKVLYRLSDVEEFIAAQTFPGNAEPRRRSAPRRRRTVMGG